MPLQLWQYYNPLCLCIGTWLFNNIIIITDIIFVCESDISAIIRFRTYIIVKMSTFLLLQLYHKSKTHIIYS